MEIHQAFTRYKNPKGHADTERFRRTLKEECLWSPEWTCPLALIRALKDRLTHDNEHYSHSALGFNPLDSLNVRPSATGLRRRSSGRGVAFPWRTCWGCSMLALGGS